MTNPEPVAYAIEPADYAALLEVCTALFDPQILTPDRRRDLANRMHVLLGRATLLTGDDLP